MIKKQLISRVGCRYRKCLMQNVSGLSPHYTIMRCPKTEVVQTEFRYNEVEGQCKIDLMASVWGKIASCLQMLIQCLRMTSANYCLFQV